MNSIRDSFERFMEKSFPSACISSTKASWDGGSYCVELYHDGSYRVLWDNQIGNLYITPGLILVIPPLSDDEYNDDPNLCFFDDIEKNFRKLFEESLLEF